MSKKKIEISEKKYKKQKKALANLTEQVEIYDSIMSRTALASTLLKIKTGLVNSNGRPKKAFKVSFLVPEGEMEEVTVIRTGETESAVKADLMTAILLQIYDNASIVRGINLQIDSFIKKLSEDECVNTENEVRTFKNAWLDMMSAEDIESAVYTNDDEIELRFKDSSTASASLDSHTREGVRTAYLASLLLRIFDEQTVRHWLECADNCYENICEKYGAGEGETSETEPEAEAVSDDDSTTTAVESDTNETADPECKAECSCDANENEGE